MALVPSALAAILSALPPATDPVSANTNIANAIKNYVTTNAVVNFSWAASAGPVPDPVTVGTGKIVSFPLVLTPSGATDPVSAIAALKAQFQSKWILATYNITAVGFSTSPGTVTSAPTLTLNITGNSQPAAMLQLATQVIAWIKSTVPPGPCSGSRAGFSGAGTVVSIQ